LGVRTTVIVFSFFVVVVVAACSSGGTARPKAARSAPEHASRTTTATRVLRPLGASPCGDARPPPDRYASVVVFSFENRTWNQVGPGFGPAMPYLHSVGAACSWFPEWVETDTGQSSLTQYVGQITGSRQASTVNDCSPSATCSTTADNLFRQLRASGRRAVNYVEGATQPCSSEENAVNHIPGLYLWGADDPVHCAEEVRPLSELIVDDLPAFAFVTPTLCNDGHDCGDQVVDAWAHAHIQPLLDSRAYRSGTVAVFVWYDETRPVPNLWISPTSKPGPRTGIAGSATSTLRAWQAMLGVPCLANACSAPDLRNASST